MDLVKVETRLRWVDIVCGHASYGMLAGVLDCVKRQSCLSGYHFDEALRGFERPRHLAVHIRGEIDSHELCAMTEEYKNKER